MSGRLHLLRLLLLTHVTCALHIPKVKLPRHLFVESADHCRPLGRQEIVQRATCGVFRHDDWCERVCSSEEEDDIRVAQTRHGLKRSMPSSASSASSTRSANKLNTLLRNGECNAGTHDTQPATHAHTSILARWVHIHQYLCVESTNTKQRSSEAVKQ